MSDHPTFRAFGRIIRDRRTELGATQAAIVARVLLDSRRMSVQYLCDIEAGRRNPSSDELIAQLAAALDLAPDLLYYSLGLLPPACRAYDSPPAAVSAAYRAFREAIRNGGDQETGQSSTVQARRTSLGPVGSTAGRYPTAEL